MLCNENHAPKCKRELKYVDPGCGCDGYHTFDELYDHRITLFIALCRIIKAGCSEGCGNSDIEVWRSRLHHDDNGYEGWFIMGLELEPGKQITYHLPLSRWEETDFADTMERAPEFDGHTSDDVLERLKKL